MTSASTRPLVNRRQHFSSIISSVGQRRGGLGKWIRLQFENHRKNVSTVGRGGGGGFVSLIAANVHRIRCASIHHVRPADAQGSAIAAHIHTHTHAHAHPRTCTHTRKYVHTHTHEKRENLPDVVSGTGGQAEERTRCCHRAGSRGESAASLSTPAATRTAGGRAGKTLLGISTPLRLSPRLRPPRAPKGACERGFVGVQDRRWIDSLWCATLYGFSTAMTARCTEGRVRLCIIHR